MNKKDQQTEAIEREHFKSRFGFIIACVGAAVGMANIWMFPYRLGQFGGCAFLIPYGIFLAIGFWGLLGEVSFGRAMQSGPIQAFKKAAQMRGIKAIEWLGAIPVIAIFGIAIGYAIVIGWILYFVFGSISGNMINAADSVEYFNGIVGSPQSIACYSSVLIVTLALMLFGVSKGVERISKFMIPIFFVLFLAIAVRVLFLPGAIDGYRYLFTPKWEFLLNPKTWVYALGQAFFSLSIAGSAMLVYGSYLGKGVDIVKSSKDIVVFDTIAALLSAIVIIPAVFAFKLDVAAGPALMFITLPEVFKSLPFGSVFASIFFIAVLCAGITSLVSMLEVMIETLIELFKLKRPIATIYVALITIGGGLLLLNGDRLSNWMDVVSIYIIPLGAILASIMFFWVCGTKFAREQTQLGHKKTLTPKFEFLSRYIFCGVAILVYFLGIIYGGIG